MPDGPHVPGCTLEHQAECCACPMDRLLDANKEWAATQVANDPEFFERLLHQQNPDYLWIGCSDSRVPANQILGLAPGAIFVQRNVGNQAIHTDMNAMSCLEYAVEALKVSTVIVCGHYNCGAVKAALQLPHASTGLVNAWISDIRECRNQHEAELRSLPDEAAQVERLVELNVVRQVFHVATSPVVARAWASGQRVSVYGLVYSLKDGLLRRVAGPVSSAEGDCARDMSTFASLCGRAGLPAPSAERCGATARLRVSIPSPAAAAAAAGGSGGGGAGAAAAGGAERAGSSGGGGGAAAASVLKQGGSPPARAFVVAGEGSPRRAVLAAMAASARHIASATGGEGGGSGGGASKAGGSGGGGTGTGNGGGAGNGLHKRSASSSALESLDAALTNVSLKDAIQRHGAWAGTALPVPAATAASPTAAAAAAAAAAAGGEATAAE